MKNNIKLFIGIIIGILLSTVVGVSATILYQADEVGFTPSNPNWNVNNLEDALNDLYENGGENVEMGEETIIITKNNTYKLPTFSTYTWESDNLDNVTISNDGIATISQSGDVYLTKNNKRFFKYSFDYRGPVVLFINGNYYSRSSFYRNDNGITSDVEDLLTDGNKGQQGAYGSLMLETGNYITFSVSIPVDISFSSGAYGDSGGSSGKTANIYKINANNEEELYASFTQQNNSQDFKTEHFEKGIYVLRSSGNYLTFSEWSIEATN